MWQAMGVGAVVQPDIFEIGGVYTIEPSTKKRTGPGGTTLLTGFRFRLVPFQQLNIPIVFLGRGFSHSR